MKYKRIKEYPNYKVSESGKVKNVNGKVLKGFLRKSKYRDGSIRQGKHLRVRLYNGKFIHAIPIHRLVAEAFIPNPLNLPQINHKDGNPLNNHKDNLEWCTYAQNTQHAYDTGLIKTENKIKGALRGGKHPQAIKVKLIDRIDPNNIVIFESISELKSFLKLKNDAQIYQAIREPQRSVKGYHIRKL